jgi:DMSO/TMAO reductase YedYZ molybdopterin-dependent catalytic subunit
MSDEPIISEDTKRTNRIPPHQILTRKWPVLHVGVTPKANLEKWDFTIFPVPFVPAVKRFSWADFEALPRTKVFGDMHCVTRWSMLDNLWEGVATRELLNHITPSAEAKFVMIHCEQGWTTNLPIADFFSEDALFATHRNGELISPDHGYPLRLVIPKLYAWKSAKWVRGIEFMAEDRPGFWESWVNGGYHLRGDPWVEQRFRDDS